LTLAYISLWLGNGGEGHILAQYHNAVLYYQNDCDELSKFY